MPLSTFKPTNTRWTNEHFQLLSYYKDLREKIKSNPFPVPNPQILGGHPRRHTRRHSCTAGIFTNTDNCKSWKIVFTETRETVCGNITNDNGPSCCSGESQWQGRLESKQQPGLQNPGWRQRQVCYQVRAEFAIMRQVLRYQITLVRRLGWSRWAEEQVSTQTWANHRPPRTFLRWWKCWQWWWPCWW